VRFDIMEQPPSPPPTYGLDIETDTAAGGLDPAAAAIVAVALAGDGWCRVFDGPETDLLTNLDHAIAELPPGVLVTWNGSRFDLPFLQDRARTCGVPLRLRLEADPRFRSHRDPLPGHDGGYAADWYGHAHLDAYQVYRRDVGASLGLPCGLKPLARMVGLQPVEVDRENIHSLSPEELAEYVASDAILTRELALRRWANASRSIDRLN
jgi:DNA polymerase elongation subunit (family B)